MTTQDLRYGIALDTLNNDVFLFERSEQRKHELDEHNSRREFKGNDRSRVLKRQTAKATVANRQTPGTEEKVKT